MARGRKPKPTELKKREGDGVHDSRRRVIPKDAPTTNGKRPRRPRHLSKSAATAWDELSEELATMGVLSTSDKAALSTLAELQGMARDAYEELKTDGTGGRIATVVKLSNNVVAAHPALSVYNKAIALAKPLYAEFGLTPSARSRVKVKPPEDNPDPFADLDGGEGA